jgi:hypothetical protein
MYILGGGKNSKDKTQIVYKGNADFGLRQLVAEVKYCHLFIVSNTSDSALGRKLILKLEFDR